MMPSRSAAATMPRCRISARSTWQRRQSVRKFENLLLPPFPLTMWSMWHSHKLTLLPQCLHLRPSRFQIAGRIVWSEISCGVLCLGMRGLQQTETLYNESSITDGPPIAQAHQNAAVIQDGPELLAGDNRLIP